MSADPPSPLLKQILVFYKLPDFPTVSLLALCLAPAIFFHRPCGQLIVIAQLLKICPLGFTEVKGLTPGSPPVFMSLPTKGFVMNREPQETKAFSKDKQLCSIHQHLHSPPPALVKTHFLTEIMRLGGAGGGAKPTRAIKASGDETWKEEKQQMWLCRRIILQYVIKTSFALPHVHSTTQHFLLSCAI